MITAINFPPINTILLDGNKTPITVTSTNGAGYYFRAKIYIDDILFDEQGWSRKDNYTATKDLMFLYHSYFKPYFIGSYTTGLLEQINFKKKVSIVIDEYDINSDISVAQLTLPDFYIIYNVKSEKFNSNDKLKILGLKSDRYRINKEGVIVIPFYVNATAEDISIVVKDNFNNILHQEFISSVAGKKIFIYTLKLEDVTLVSIADYLNVKISIGSESADKIYTLIKLPSFDVKEIVYQNNFGFYIPAYFDGDFEDVSGYTVQSYEQYDTSLAVYAIEEEATYTINSGNLNIYEKDIINEIANSIDVFFKNGSNYVNVISSIKKSTNQKSRLNIFSEDLQFKVKKGLPFNNENLTGTLTGNTISLNIQIDSITLLNSNPPITQYQIDFTSGFPIFQLFWQVRLSPSFEWSPPQLYSDGLSPFNVDIYYVTNFQFRIYAFYNGLQIFSNIKTVTS